MTSGAVVDNVFDCTHSEESHELDSMCAICFENRPFVDLPCSCKINYCASCWNRALAVSVQTRGKAQCPSCRAGFHVDFDQDEGCVVFSKADRGMSVADWRSRVYDKARPVQIQRLKDFGSAMERRSSTLSNAGGAIMAGAQVKGEKRSSPRDSLCCKPTCICGDVLELVDSRTRVIRMLEDTDPGWRSRVSDPEQRIEKLAASSLITCDLCDHPSSTGFIWTCKSGPNVVMHPAAYDVCESCVSRYASCSGVPSNASAAHMSRNACQLVSRCCTPSAMTFLHGGHNSPQTFAADGGSTSDSDSSSAAGSAGFRGGRASNLNSSLQARLRRARVSSRILGCLR